MLIYIILIVIGVTFYLHSSMKSTSKSCGCESFKPDYSDYNSIDRIQVDDKYAYCMGSKPTCETGLPIKGGLYSNGNTYRSNCDDGSTMICDNVFLKYYNSLDTSDNSDTYVWNTPNGTPITFSTIYKGFTEPTSYIPALINDTLINFYNDTNVIVDSINKCSILDIDENNCKKALNIPFTFADTSNNDINAFNNATGYNREPDVIGSFFPSYTEKIPESKGFSGMYPGLPCVADYGASEGDNICNGEVGLIQDQTLVCPYYKPICNGYRCGSTFGKCIYSK